MFLQLGVAGEETVGELAFGVGVAEDARNIVHHVVAVQHLLELEGRAVQVNHRQIVGHGGDVQAIVGELTSLLSDAEDELEVGAIEVVDKLHGNYNETYFIKVKPYAWPFSFLREQA